MPLAKRKLNLWILGVFLFFSGAAQTLYAQAGVNKSVLNPNLATAEELGKLPGLTEATIKRILENRPYLSALKLREVLQPVLNEAARTKLFIQLFVPINLNTASREEILLVPGVGKRMAHEFEEYRPYKHLKQFRREIAKYVSDEEVARMEQYVFVPIDLNTASTEDILSIPGVGKRMAHEFEEYRPYKSMSQFTREIGKYVDKDELARLERYVTLNEK